MGYKRTPSTSQTGDFSVRGEIIDIYPINEDTPFRINFFDDEIETIKKINTETQMSIAHVEELDIFPLYEVFYDQLEIPSIKEKILKENSVNDKISFALESIENYQNLEQLYIERQRGPKI